MTARPDIAAVVLTYNEERNIRHCLQSIAGFCPLYVVDSGSTDATVEICRSFTDNVYTHAYENHASQWQWALENLPLENSWVLALDADFTVTDDLKQAITDQLADVPAGVNGIYVRHLYHFGGNLIRFGGTKAYWLRIVRRGHASADLSDLVDFRFLVEGSTAKWKAPVVEYNRHDDDISIWLAKQDKFSVRLALEEELRRRKLLDWERKPSLLGNTDERIMRLRDIWLRMPLFLRPVIYFIYRYILALGFLDGRGGFLYHSLQGFWLRLVVDWKISQLRKLDYTDEQLLSLKNLSLQTPQGSVDKLHQMHVGASADGGDQ